MWRRSAPPGRTGSDGSDGNGRGRRRGRRRGRVVAACYLTHAQVGALFGEEEIRLAEFIATLAGTALENAEGFAEVQVASARMVLRHDLPAVEARFVDRAQLVGMKAKPVRPQALAGISPKSELPPPRPS